MQWKVRRNGLSGLVASGAKNVTGLVSVVIDSVQPGPVHVKHMDRRRLLRFVPGGGGAVEIREGL